ncbi:MAG TPA: hypothetical protein VH985_00290 [Candidatus Binatia bacterium]
MLVPLEPLMDVALEPVVDVPVDPITGALGATGALLGAVLPIDLAGRWMVSNGVTCGVAVRSSGGNSSRRAALSFERARARHCLMNLVFCLPS